MLLKEKDRLGICRLVSSDAVCRSRALLSEVQWRSTASSTSSNRILWSEDKDHPSLTPYPSGTVVTPREVSVAQSHPTLCNPMDYSSSGFSVHGILQARMLEWVAIPFSRESSRPRDRTRVSFIAGRFFTIWATREALKDISAFNSHFLYNVGTVLTPIS